jgi:2-oxo-4-hydroxy-4-carboxy-5-ureidoimidazoline decarboxylase
VVTAGSVAVFGEAITDPVEIIAQIPNTLVLIIGAVTFAVATIGIAQKGKSVNRRSMPQKLTIEQVNHLNKEEFVERFGLLYEHSPWVAEKAWHERSFASLSELRRAFQSAMYGAPREKQLNLIRAHPDLAGKAAMEGELTPESTREQASAGLDRLSPEEYETFTRLNSAYREKFGFPLIFAVKGHTKESILANAETRLENSWSEEIETALSEIAKIADLRLRDLVELDASEARGVGT